ncbi:MAG TPA: hypothetical protein VII06_16550 [Chloroflexota bacterium]
MTGQSPAGSHLDDALHDHNSTPPILHGGNPPVNQVKPTSTPLPIPILHGPNPPTHQVNPAFGTGTVTPPGTTIVHPTPTGTPPQGPGSSPSHGGGVGQCGGNGGSGGAGGDCTIIVNNTTQVSNVSWTMPAPILASAPVYVDAPPPVVQTVVAPPIVTCALPFGTLYGHPADPKLQPVIVDGVTVDYLPLCQTYTYEPFVDCATAYYFYADQNLFYCVVPA